MEITDVISKKVAKGEKFYNLRENRLLDLDKEYFHYTIYDLS